MGNVITDLISAAFNVIFSRCLDCTLNKAELIRNLEDNVKSLEKIFKELIEVRDDLMRRVVIAQQRQMKLLNQVEGWLSRVEDEQTEIGLLIRESTQEIENLCLGGYCSKNCKSSYEIAIKVEKKLLKLADLKLEGRFPEVAVKVQEVAADERPIEPIVVGFQSTFDKVWKCLGEEKVGVIGLYGMGGVGKTTLLTQINNKFLDTPNDFDIVIWVVVSKDLQLDKIQETIGKKIGLFDESSKDMSLDEKALDIFKSLSKKKFVLLLDDIWDRVDLIKVGVPVPPVKQGSKVVFTTRSKEICGAMKAQESFKVECLRSEEAWKLFQENLERDVLDSHPDIPGLAQDVAKKCDGLPLALITIARAMSCKKTPEEWRYAIQVLKRSASEFSGMKKEVFSLLKYSYDSLPANQIRSCLLYCSLFSEDYSILKTDLIDYWIGEGFLNEDDGNEAQNQGYSIIGMLIRACLLEEEEDGGEYYVKMHDVIREMALWIACEIEKEERLLVHAGDGLIEAPKKKKWEGVRRISLMKNKIENLSEFPSCPQLLTLFLNHNSLNIITGDFFQFMPSLKVLNLSYNRSLTELPSGISKLVSLQLLDLSWTRIKELPIELKAVTTLKCLRLEYTYDLQRIPRELISHFSNLHVLRMFRCSYRISDSEISGDSVLVDGAECLVDELLLLKYLNVLTIDLRSFHAFRRLLSSVKLQNSTQSLCLRFDDSKALDVLSLADLKHLHTVEITYCKYLVELKIEHVIGHPYVFYSLQKVRISFCTKLREVTWIIFVPNLKFLDIYSCDEMEEIISLRKLGEVLGMMENLTPFANLEYLVLTEVPNLRSIYSGALTFTHLKEICVNKCPRLKKLPLSSKSIKEQKIVVKGEEQWWKELQWEDEAAQNVFLPCYKPR